MLDSTAAIQAAGLTKTYAGITVLDGFDLRVEPGSVFALMGPNGAGKTTAVRILATLTSPDSGHASVAGFDISTQRHEVRRRLSLTGQAAALDELQTGTENLQMMGRLLGLSARQAALRSAGLLDQFGLTDAGGRRVGTYSGGMRRRLDLAAGLVGRPQVIFLDEPTTGLDPRSRQTMWEIVAGLAADGVTVFLTTQYLDEADRLADRIAVIDAGRIVAEGSADQLKAQIPGQRIDLRLADLDTFEEVLAELGSRAVHSDRPSLTVGVATDGAAAQVRDLLDELDPRRSRIERFTLQTTTLDDVFFALTGQPATTSAAPSSESETVSV